MLKNEKNNPRLAVSIKEQEKTGLTTNRSANRFPIPEIEMYLVEALPGFSCRRCARCCMKKLIPLYQRDIERLKPHVREKFYEETTGLERRITNAEYKMAMVDDNCVFLEGTRCRNYDLRPDTCRRHPFLATEKHLLVASTCPGVDWLSTQSGEEYRALSEGISKAIDSFLEKRKLRRTKMRG